MAGRRRSKSDNSAGLVIGILILFVIGWVISHWQVVLFVIGLAAVAAFICHQLKQITGNTTERRTDTQAVRQRVPLPNRRLSKWDLEKLDDEQLNELIADGLDTTDTAMQLVEQQKRTSIPRVDANYLRGLHGASPRVTTPPSPSTSTPQTQVMKRTTEPTAMACVVTELRDNERQVSSRCPMKPEDLEAKLQELEAIIRN